MNISISIILKSGQSVRLNFTGSMDEFLTHLWRECVKLHDLGLPTLVGLPDGTAINPAEIAAILGFEAVPK